ncbi:ATPase, partial [Streptomyces sp. NPDC004667]
PPVPAPASGTAPVSAAPGAPGPQGSRPAPVAPLRPRGPAGTGTRTHPVPAPAPGPVPVPALTAASVTELPRRVRQASLVPQLREAAGAGAPGARTDEEPPDRSPEQARDRMAAFRAGWARGTQETSNPNPNPNGGPHTGSEGEAR